MAELGLPQRFLNVSVLALNMTTRQKISRFLDPEGYLIVCDEREIMNNWSGLAELAGFTFLEIKNLMLRKHPTIELLEEWSKKELHDPTVGSLWKFLESMDRVDVLNDCRKNITHDCDLYIDLQMMKIYDLEEKEPTRDMDIDPAYCVTVSDVEKEIENVANTKLVGSRMDTSGTGDSDQQVMFDAFVCYAPEKEDIVFVKEMIAELEGKYGIRLFVPGRDDIPGVAVHEINAYLIEERCRRVIAILTHNFSKSDACDFNIKFASCLSPGGRKKRLIPVKLEKDVEMQIFLKVLSICDMSDKSNRDWQWPKLVKALQAPVSPSSDLLSESELKDIKLPQSLSYGHISDTVDTTKTNMTGTRKQEVDTDKGATKLKTTPSSATAIEREYVFIDAESVNEDGSLPYPRYSKDTREWSVKYTASVESVTVVSS